MEQMIFDFIMKYIPGYEWLIVFIVAHIMASTIAHIKEGDFKLSEWPGFLTTWLMFMAGVILVNGVVAVSTALTAATILLPVVTMLQGLIYGMYFSYYLDNIFKHMNMMGWPVDPGLIEFIKGMVNKIKGTFTGGTSV